MKTAKIKEMLLRELADEFRKNPATTLHYTEEDAQKYGVSLPALDAIASDLKAAGLIKRQYDGNWQITTAGMEQVEETEVSDPEDSGESLKERLEQLERRVKVLEDRK